MTKSGGALDARYHLVINKNVRQIPKVETPNDRVISQETVVADPRVQPGAYNWYKTVQIKKEPD